MNSQQETQTQSQDKYELANRYRLLLERIRVSSKEIQIEINRFALKGRTRTLVEGDRLKVQENKQ